MISKDTLKRGYNKFDYVVGAHTPPYFTNDDTTPGETCLHARLVGTLHDRGDLW